MRLSCHAFRDNAVRLQLFALAYIRRSPWSAPRVPSPERHDEQRVAAVRVLGAHIARWYSARKVA
jgi:hypothetical protein